MKAITCPQCGGLIKRILPHQQIAGCDYCGAKVITEAAPSMPEQIEAEIADFRVPESVVIPRTPVRPIFIAISGTGFIIFLMFLIALIPAKSHSAWPAPESDKAVNYPPLAPVGDKIDDGTSLKFGGQGTHPGLFEGACAIAVDKEGNIFVADDARRIQRFDQTGKYLNEWFVESDKNAKIEKIAAAGNGDLDVLIGGKIIIFNGETGKQVLVISDSRRHYIDDFVLTAAGGGGVTYVAESGGREEVVQMKSQEISNRFAAIHSRAAAARIPAAAIKIAVSESGEIFSVYAIASLTGTLEYVDEDLMTFHFNTDGTLVNKFAPALMSRAILTDNQNRIYILTRNEIAVFADTGGEIRRVKVTGNPKAFAADAQNNLYIVSDNFVRRLNPVF